MKCQNRTFEIKKVSLKAKANGESANKTKKILTKKRLFKNGLSVKDELNNLNTSISLAKGLLAILSTHDQSVWIKKCQTAKAQEHTRILLQEVMEEIWNADLIVTRLILDPRPRLTV